MTGIPNLFLKWRAFRSLIGDARSDAEIGRLIFGDDDGPIKFSRLLYGDYGCAPEIASEFVALMNRRIATYRSARGLDVSEPDWIAAADLFQSTHQFTHKLIDAAGECDDERLAETHHELVAGLTSALPPDNAAPLQIERFAATRAFASMVPSGGDRPLTFVPERDLGQFAVEYDGRKAVAAYAFVTRDSSPAGQRFWDNKWGETVLWLPSPFEPVLDGGYYNLLPGPQPVQPIPGRFIATAVLVFDANVLPRLDLRGAGSPPSQLDELQTARFLTNMRRLAKPRKNSGSPIKVATNEYIVSLAA